MGAIGVEIGGIWGHGGPLRWRLGAFGAIGVHWGGDWGHLGPRGATEVEIGGH